MEMLSPLHLATVDDTSLKVQVKGLSVNYGKFRALSGIDLAIHSRKITAIIGPSGAVNPLCCVPSTA